MKNSVIILLFAAALLASPTQVRAQSEPKSVPPSYPDRPPKVRRTAPPDLPPMQPDPNEDAPLLDGFWPTDYMVERFVQNAVQESAGKYELSPEQLSEIQERMTDRWSGFLRENRNDIQPLVNEYVRANMAPKPPTADEVSEWAAKATPIFRRVRANLLEGEFEMRSRLTPNQRALFDKERLERRKSLDRFQSRLRRWSVGQFDEKDWWNQSNTVLPEGIDPAALLSADDRANESTPTDKAAPDYHAPKRVRDELLAWEKYVRNFCDHFELDQSQRNTATSILREMLNRAHGHVYKRRDLIAQLEAKIANPAGVDPEKIEQDMVELYGPLDRLFRELSARVERLPTRGQRSRILSQQKAKPEPAASPSPSPSASIPTKKQ
ncbi:MAG: hypothetical protein GXP29_09575 [Planctomycetes bacterium]|nr:hypothetical protein [Planctomycetota bacterium]